MAVLTVSGNVELVESLEMIEAAGTEASNIDLGDAFVAVEIVENWDVVSDVGIVSSGPALSVSGDDG